MSARAWPAGLPSDEGALNKEADSIDPAAPKPTNKNVASNVEFFGPVMAVSSSFSRESGIFATLRYTCGNYFGDMSIILTRDHHPKNGKYYDRLLVDGQLAAIVGPVRAETAELLVSYFGSQWQWWALIAGVKGGPWLVRNSSRESDAPLVLDEGDQPRLLKSSWDTPAVEEPHINNKFKKTRQPIRASRAV